MEGTNGSSDLLALVLAAAKDLSLHDDPSEVMRLALDHGRKVIRFDRNLAATRRELSFPTIRITRSDAPGTSFHDPIGHDEFPPLGGGLLAELLYAGQPRVIDDLRVAADDPSARYLVGMRSLVAVPQFRSGEATDMVFHLRCEPAAFAPSQLPEIVLISNFFGQIITGLARAEQLQAAERSMKEQYEIIARLSNTVMDSAMDLKQYSGVLEERVRERTAELAEANLETIFMLAQASEAKDHDTPPANQEAHPHARAAAWPERSRGRVPRIRLGPARRRQDACAR